MTEIKTKTFEMYEIEIDGLEYFCTFNAEAKEYSWGGTYFDPPEYEFEVTGISDLDIIYFDEDNNEIKVGSEIIIEIAEEYLYSELDHSDF
jgi:hypothetical protein